MSRAVRATAGLCLVLSCASLPGDPLDELHPLVLPWRERVTLLTCRWPADATLGVHVSDDASDDERRALAAVLDAWVGAGLGVRFAPAAPDRAEIEVRFVDEAVQRDDGRPGSGRTRADCRVDPGRSAVLARARVEVARRTAPDWRGHVRAVTPAERAGAALHELGHALGFQGHVPGPGDPMVRSAENLRRLGARVLSGGSVSSPALRALYALPSGASLGVTPVSPWSTRRIDRLAAHAEARGWNGPFARVGDVSARVFWTDASGREAGVWIANLEETLRDPTRILVVADAAAREALAGNDGEALAGNDGEGSRPAAGAP